jgi:hypothetical protein
MISRRSTPPASRLLQHAAGRDLDLTETVYDAGRTMGKHAHAETCVTLILRGGVEERVVRRAAVASTASIGIKPAQIEHSDRFGPAGSRTLKLRIGMDFARRLEEFSRPLERWAWVPLGGGAPVMLRMRRRLWEDRTETGWLDELAIELLAALQADDRLRDRPTAPAWLRAVRREVLGRYREGVRTRSLAEGAGVHPVYLARAFRGGASASRSANACAACACRRPRDCSRKVKRARRPSRPWPTARGSPTRATSRASSGRRPA